MLDAILVAHFLYIGMRQALNFVHGGNSSNQGDWLINSTNVDVRRALSGDVFIFLADTLQIDLVGLVIATQMGMLLALLLCVRVLAREAGFSVAMLLFASSGSFILFWMGDPQGANQKELLAFLGLALFAIGLLRQGAIAQIVGILLLTISFFTHEAMLLFLPVVWGMVWLQRQGGAPWQLGAALGLAASATGVIALTYALNSVQLDTVEPVCAPLRERGLPIHMCDGAVGWLDKDLAFALRHVAEHMAFPNVPLFVVAYIVSLAPIVYLSARLAPRSLVLFILVATVAPILPLYVIAVDWGRWISLHVFAVTLLFIVALRRNQLTVTREVRMPVVIGFVVLALVLTPNHLIGLVPGGPVGKIADDALTFLGVKEIDFVPPTEEL